MAKQKTPKRDFAQIAFAVAQQATGEQPPQPPPEPPTVVRARKGGLKGGKARANALTPEQRAEIARIAAEARWKRAD